MVCIRAAWLVMGSLSVPLENAAGGWVCQTLDLGYPAPREVTSNKPDQDGADDRTSLMGPRVVQADVTALVGAGARVDAVAASFAPFMAPTARPVLHYILDRPGAPERTITLRPSGYAWPIAGDNQRDISLQFVAPDPAILDANTQTATAWAGSSSNPGRPYNLTFNRSYPAGGASGTTGQIRTVGDLPVRPKYRIYGPVTAPLIMVTQGSTSSQIVRFVASYTVGAGHYVDVDSANKTAVDDTGASVVGSVDWQNSAWTPIAPNPAPAVPAGLILSGSSTSQITQVDATWADRYLT